jgi:type I restriction enzyme, R subunit
MNEADTCRTYVLPKLKSAGWEDEFITEQLVLTPGRIVPIGDRHTRKDGLRPDYVLFIRQNIPIAVVEAKAEYAHLELSALLPSVLDRVFKGEL